MADSYPTSDGRPRRSGRPRRRGRKVLVTLVVLVLLLGGLAVAADRVAVSVAERTIADQVQQEVSRQRIDSAAPQVEVAGFPFLNQVVAGRYERISIQLRDVRGSVQGNAVNLPTLDVDARNVRASLDTLRTGQGDVVAETVDGTGTITYDSLAALLDRPGLKLGERDGRLAVTAPVDILGQELTVSGTAEVTVGDQGQVALKVDEVDAEGLPALPLARTLLNQWAQGISIDVPLPELPFQLTVREVRPLPGGLEVTADAREVPINQRVG
ncbi:LmeA family phospholipid-binding protein [Micromonospora sp. SH-82]|uniref:LmeA family phospholipid-binding protein n=1 Tax=Micromonospora sp. SH-82 TaxID=3132938 RepID=UPI003EC0EB5F